MRNTLSLFTVIIFFFIIFIAGCSSNKNSPGIPQGKFKQQLFETPQELVTALTTAVNSYDSADLLKILGPDGRDLIFSGDPVSDRLELTYFGQRLAERSELIPYISAEFSNVSIMKLRIGRMGTNAGIPIINDGHGWRLASHYFAPRSVKRRIASNEIEVWRACMEYVEAQREFIKQDRNADGILEYAQQLVSSPGKKDGLYWKVSPGEKQSPLGEVVAEANAKGYSTGSKDNPKPFNGYVFKILTQQGADARDGKRDYIVDGKMTKGFALVAYPVEWSVSGLRTFVVGPQGSIFSKNLGISTENLASQMQEYNPDRSWSWVQQPQVNEFEEYLETL